MKANDTMRCALAAALISACALDAAAAYVCGFRLPDGSVCRYQVGRPGERCHIHKSEQPPAGAIAGALPMPEKPFQHPLFPWNATVQNNAALRSFIANARPETNNIVLLFDKGGGDGVRVENPQEIGYVVAQGVSGAAKDYRLTFVDGEVVAVERRYDAAALPEL